MFDEALPLVLVLCALALWAVVRVAKGNDDE
jgi:hypothetical protein